MYLLYVPSGAYILSLIRYACQIGLYACQDHWQKLHHVQCVSAHLMDLIPSLRTHVLSDQVALLRPPAVSHHCHRRVLSPSPSCCPVECLLLRSWHSICALVLP